MKNSAITFLQIALVLLGITVLVFMLVEPHFEGRNIDATVFEIYFKDPFLACAYTSSTLFFFALYKAFTLLGNVKKNQLFSQSSVSILRTIRYCTTTLAVLLVGAVAYLFIVLRGRDDIAGGVAMGLFLILIFSVVAISSLLFERHLQKKF